MSPSLEVLLLHYRHELAALVQRAGGAGAPLCPSGEELVWAEAGEGEGWLTPESAMEIRRLAVRTRFYEGRARSAASV